MNRKFLLTGFIIFDLLFFGVLIFFFLRMNKNSSENQIDDKLPVMVGVEPQAFFVERIGGDRVSVEVLVPSGKEPETYTPSPDQIKKLARCKVFFRVGFVAEESLLSRLKTIAPKLLVIDTRQSLSLRQQESHQHDHDYLNANTSSGAGCSDDGIDPHVWVSPALVKLQAKTILDALISLDKAGEKEYRTNYNQWIADLDEIQRQLHEQLDPFRGKAIYVYHPTYGYFCDEFGLVQKAVEIEGKSPTPKILADWIKDIKDEKVKYLIVQPEFNSSVSEKIHETTGTKLLPHSTLDRDYFGMLKKLTAIIKENS
ncbi:MAG: zinc ABC transporter substrate-binding protein [Planctomycetaceae bacterium]|nr:zinc ABC transporter substrate-binding protein [Planctomycetaceae bacterium]